MLTPAIRTLLLDEYTLSRWYFLRTILSFIVKVIDLESPSGETMKTSEACFEQLTALTAPHLPRLVACELSVGEFISENTILKMSGKL